MIHKFKMKDINIVCDVESGAVHVVDDIVYDMIDLFDKRPTSSDYNKVKNELSSKYSEQLLIDAFAEVMDLCEANVLYTENLYKDIASKINKKPQIKALCLHISHDCNLRCGYCFAGTGNFCGDRLLMSEETGKKAIDFVIQNSGQRKNIEIDFFGGEPLMNFDVVKKLCIYANEQGALHNKNFRLTLTTNGVLLDEDKLKFINEYMSNLVLSIDGRKSVNDNMRKTISGGSSYDVILPNFIRAAESRNQDNYYVRGTFTRHNLDFYNDVLHLADLGFKQISVEPVVGGVECDYSIKEEDLPEIYEQYELLSDEYIKRRNTPEWFNFFHFMIDLEQGPCVIKRMSGCGAGCDYVAITPEGDIYPCHQFVGNKDFCIGNIYDDDYCEEKTKMFANTNVFTKSECKTCWAKYYCSGGCHANAYQFNGSIEKPYEIGCAMEKKRVECALYITAKLHSTNKE